MSCTICFGVYILTPAFIAQWLGPEYILDNVTLGLLVATLYIGLTRSTVDAFIKGGLNLSHASASSYVHRNTLIYRIEKVNRVIGLDLRNFEDCLIFVNMREIYKMVVKKQ